MFLLFYCKKPLRKMFCIFCICGAVVTNYPICVFSLFQEFENILALIDRL